MRKTFLVAITSVLLGLGFATFANAELVAYWPFDDFDNEESTPDVVNGYDLQVEFLDNTSFFDDGNHVDGRIGKAFEFFNEDTTILSRIHDPEDLLPINKHPEFTISFWSNVEGTGQNDLRLISEGSIENGTPLFNIGTANNGNDGTLDIFIRNEGNTGHLRTNAEPFDAEWHHIGWTFRDGVHSIYIDGVLDRTVDWPSFGETDPFPLDNTSVGGIQRANPSHWVTGIIDDVAMWNEVLPPVSISSLAAETVTPLDALDVLIGDFNFDGVIDDDDYGIIVTNFRDPGTYNEGDINGDGVVDLFDFGEFLDRAEAVGASVPQTIPEPTGLALVVMGLLFSGLLRKRGQARG